MIYRCWTWPESGHIFYFDYINNDIIIGLDERGGDGAKNKTVVPGGCLSHYGAR